MSYEMEADELTEELTRMIQRASIEALSDAELKQLKDLLKKFLTEYPYPKIKTEEEEFLGQGRVGDLDDIDHLVTLKKVAESLSGKGRVTEQWVAPVPYKADSITGHIRDFLNVTGKIEEAPGDSINVPYVKSFDMGDWGTYGSATLNDLTGSDQVGDSEFSVEEAGLKLLLKYKHLETYSANLIAMIEEKCRIAALRAEDKKVLDDIYNTSGILSLDKSGAGSDFDADFIAEALQEFEDNGVEANPSDYVIFLSPSMHFALMKDVIGSMALAYALPEVAQKGRLEEFLAVDIRTVPKAFLPDDTTNVYAIMFKKKDGHSFAPKRDMLIETEKQPESRDIKIVATHCCAFGVVDSDTCLKIKTQVSP